MRFVRSHSSPVVREQPSVLQFFVDFGHGYLAFAGYLALVTPMLGVTWLAIAAAFVISVCHAIGVLMLRDRGADPTHIPTLKRFVENAAASASERWEARKLRAEQCVY